MLILVDLFKTILIGVIQGITEWLPVSSTGHMILFNSFFPLHVSREFWEMFSVVIQLGSILAVVVLYFHRLNPFALSKSPQEKAHTWNLWGKVAVGSVPLAAVGFMLDDWLNALLYGDEMGFSVNLSGKIVIAAALIVYGIGFVLIEKRKENTDIVKNADDVSYGKAFGIGAFQSLAIIPGTSRSGSTILGARLLGVSRVASAEFSFFLAIPAMFGASLYKIAKFVFAEGAGLSGCEGIILAVGCVVAFVVSLVVVRFLTGFLQRHSFSPFGFYRIVLGIALILWAVL